MNEKVGLLAGAVWTALSENGTMTAKELKKAAKLSYISIFLSRRQIMLRRFIVTLMMRTIVITSLAM